MTPVDVPYVPILLNETFITALWDTGAKKSFISEEVYHKYFSYRRRQKTKDRVVTAQDAPCCHSGIDFMKESKLTLDFDQKSLIIPDDQIKQLTKVKKPVVIDLSDTKLGAGKKQKKNSLVYVALYDIHHTWHYRVRLRESGQPIGRLRKTYQPGLTHVLYHEIDTGDKGLVVSRPYRHDRVKQGIIDYNIAKMLREGSIRPIQSPYTSPVVLTCKNNDLPPDSPEAYPFAIDYRKLNAITKYPRYPLPVINDLIPNIPHTGVMLTLDLKSGYFQLLISLRDIKKTAFITRMAPLHSLECFSAFQGWR
ncbi:retrovirus-related Pol polyprotein from transposon 297 [Trichonephila clavipes]|nr:retrovirus-related Pol polyprotein from transposon 297 [Trichonephila clavipes]